ncbi:histidine ammonia-lyase, partial [bacterium]|nr:histidine ammonia-lyase [bacterium]
MPRTSPCVEIRLRTRTAVGSAIALEDVGRAADGAGAIVLTAAATRRIAAGRAVVERIIRDGRTVYGITTGFGKFAEVRIAPAEIEDLQRNLVVSHATAVGPPFNERQVRAIMFLQANQLARGASGVRPEAVRQLIAMLNAGVTPLVPQQGSVGASGDLSPMAHIALVMIGRGRALFRGRVMPGAAALRRAGISPPRLAAQEGLALTNGTEVMTAVGILALLAAEDLCRAADIAGAMSLEALRGTATAFDPRIHSLRPHPGQLSSAGNLRRLLADSAIRKSHAHCPKVQDAYSLRCMPQVHGATRTALA